MLLAEGGGAGVKAESALAGIEFGLCEVEEFSGAECAIVAFVVVVIGSAAELTSVCTLVKLLDGAGKTTALASESSFCKTSESLAGAGVEVRGAAVPVELGARLLGGVEIRFGEKTNVAVSAALMSEESTEVSDALGAVGTNGD
jgi:hypothetical protein